MCEKRYCEECEFSCFGAMSSRQCNHDSNKVWSWSEGDHAHRPHPKWEFRSGPSVLNKDNNCPMFSPAPKPEGAI